jgi:hypothetical protein
VGYLHVFPLRLLFIYILILRLRNSGSSPSPAAQQVQSNNMQHTSSGGAGNGKSSAVRGLLIMTNAGLMVFMAATGALAIYHSNDIDDTGVIFVGIYLMLFSALLFIYEVIQIAPCDALDNLYKRNFGFLYGIIGKCLFLIL